MKLAIVLLFSTLAFSAELPVTVPVSTPVHKLSDAQKVQALLVYKAQADKLIGRLRMQLKAAQEQLQAEQLTSDQDLSIGIQAIYANVGAKPDEETFSFDTLEMTKVEKKKEEVKPAETPAPEVKK